MSSEIMDAYWAAPPMARTLATAIVISSFSAHFGLVGFHWFLFLGDRIFTFPPEIWRFVTSFLISGPQIGLILDPYFAYQYLSQLEMGNPRFPRKEDLLWYLITVGSFIIAMNQFYLSNILFLPALIMAMTYTATQDQRGQKAGFFFFTVPAQALPYCMLLSSLLMSPGLIPLQISGLLAAHMYDFLSRIWPEFGGGPNLLATPAFVSRLVQTPRVLRRSYGTAVHPAAASAGTSTGASTGSVLPDSWKTRGSGRRLGGT